MANNTRNVKTLLEKGATMIGVGLGSVMVPAGPCPLRDDNLMAVAATMMQRSLDAEKNASQPVESVGGGPSSLGNDEGNDEEFDEHVSDER